LDPLYCAVVLGLAELVLFVAHSAQFCLLDFSSFDSARIFVTFSNQNLCGREIDRAQAKVANIRGFATPYSHTLPSAPKASSTQATTTQPTESIQSKRKKENKTQKTDAEGNLL
jgi:hypothetical protein